MVQLTNEITDICAHCNQPIFTEEVKRPALSLGGITISPMTRACIVAGFMTHLTNREFDILYLLMSRAGKVCSKDTIFACIHGLDSDVEVKVIDVFVCKLRKKLGDHATLLKTVWGRGYCFDKPINVGVGTAGYGENVLT